METVSVKLSERNQMVLPKAARKALGIKPGERVLVVIDGDEVRLLADPSSWADYVYGLGEQAWASLGGGESFLRDERASWADRVASSTSSAGLGWSGRKSCVGPCA